MPKQNLEYLMEYLCRKPYIGVITSLGSAILPLVQKSMIYFQFLGVLVGVSVGILTGVSIFLDIKKKMKS